MNMRGLKRWGLVLAIFLTGIIFLSPKILFAQTSRSVSWIPVTMHIATTASDGTLTIDDVADVAARQGVKAVIVTDRDYMSWEYGIWPFRRIFKKNRQINAVSRAGFTQYLETIDLAARKNPDVLMIPGVESAPFYFWSGRPYSRGFTLRDCHKHLLAVGLRDSRDYENLPVVANPGSLRRDFSVCDWPRLWPFGALLAGLFSLGVSRHKKSLGYSILSRRLFFVAVGLLCVSALAFLNENPFQPELCHPYDQSAAMTRQPYQRYIDYVRDKGGLTFWAHPEARNVSTRGPVCVATDESIDDLFVTDGYTGFLIFPEGYQKIGSVGGVWDDLLTLYCRGRRKFPVWAVGGLAFDTGTKEELAQAMASVVNHTRVEDITEKEIVSALRQGRVYVSRGSSACVLTDYYLESEDGTRAQMGQTLTTDQAPVICVMGAVKSEAGSTAKIDVVSNGEILSTHEVTGPFDIRYDPGRTPRQKTYYRIQIRHKDQLIVTNPVFVQPALRA